MSLSITVAGGPGDFEIAKECVQTVRMTTGFSPDSNTHKKTEGSTIILIGRILAGVDGLPFDSTRQLELWSAVPASKAGRYRRVEVVVKQGGVVERRFTFPNAFVVDYVERFDDEEGTGIFILKIKQKQSKRSGITSEDGYLT